MKPQVHKRIQGSGKFASIQLEEKDFGDIFSDHVQESL
jgi:hypothetical protein